VAVRAHVYPACSAVAVAALVISVTDTLALVPVISVTERLVSERLVTVLVAVVLHHVAVDPHDVVAHYHQRCCVMSVSVTAQLLALYTADTLVTSVMVMSATSDTDQRLLPLLPQASLATAVAKRLL